MEDKYNMSKEQNLFLAKRNIVDSIWKSARLEGILVTFPETQAIYDGGNVAHLNIDEIQLINNLKHAWKFVFASLDNKLDEKIICSINSLVGNNLIESPGKIRIYNVNMGGTDWKPKLPTQNDIERIIEEYEKATFKTDGILTMMCKLMKLQYFNDGNKRTSMLAANFELIKNGKGIISISEENKVEFGNRLIRYYEEESNLEELKKWLYDNCLNGLD